MSVAIGADLGAKAGIWGGLGTIAGGALVGGALGGAVGGLGALVLRLKDRILGEPVVYYELFGAVPATGGGSSIHSGMGGGDGIDMGTMAGA